MKKTPYRVRVKLEYNPQYRNPVSIAAGGMTCSSEFSPTKTKLLPGIRPRQARKHIPPIWNRWLGNSRVRRERMAFEPSVPPLRLLFSPFAASTNR